uniref:Uncharacterized protein n=1 Tax=Rhizophora mucronata TaxID=61149 RepID=A0A2P2NIN2_RHIMU
MTYIRLLCSLVAEVHVDFSAFFCLVAEKL